VDWQASQFECAVQRPVRKTEAVMDLPPTKPIEGPANHTRKGSRAPMDHLDTCPKRRSKTQPVRKEKRLHQLLVTYTPPQSAPSREQAARRAHLLYLAHGSDPTRELEEWCPAES
jgi:hypothetical protein